MRKFCNVSDRIKILSRSQIPQTLCQLFIVRGVVPGGAKEPSDFGRSINPISIRGGRLLGAHQIILAPPNFQVFLRPWLDVNFTLDHFRIRMSFLQTIFYLVKIAVAQKMVFGLGWKYIRQVVFWNCGLTCLPNNHYVIRQLVICIILFILGRSWSNLTFWPVQREWTHQGLCCVRVRQSK